MAETKAVCGGFLIGEGLKMEGKVLSATGGGGEDVERLDLEFEYDDVEDILYSSNATMDEIVKAFEAGKLYIDGKRVEDGYVDEDDDGRYLANATLKTFECDPFDEFPEIMYIEEGFYCDVYHDELVLCAEEPARVDSSNIPTFDYGDTIQTADVRKMALREKLGWYPLCILRVEASDLGGLSSYHELYPTEFATEEDDTKIGVLSFSCISNDANYGATGSPKLNIFEYHKYIADGNVVTRKWDKFTVDLTKT